MVNTVIKSLSLGVLLSNVVLVLSLLQVLYSFATKKEPEYFKKFKKFLNMYGNKLALFFAVVSMTGSLFLSEIAQFTPCVLCLYQRIMMYPIAIVMAVGIYLKKKDFRVCVLPLSIIGGLISSYHYYLQNASNPYASCTTIGFSVSCTETYSMNFGYITIPFMALTGFVLISLLVNIGNNN